MDIEQFKGHTPGPWYLDNWADDDDLEFRITECALIQSKAKRSGGSDVCYVAPIWNSKNILTPEQMDNARLIAAAPDLLAEVLRLREQLASRDRALQELRWFAESVLKDGR